MTVVAIDGPAGAGKSTVAKALARELGFTYLDTGAMYRAVALTALRRRANPAAVAQAITIAVDDAIHVDGEDVSDAIRTPEISQAASQAAADPEVRRALVAEQQRLLSCGDWVAEGRDIGTVVAPAAELKVFLTADPRQRARRRARELGLDEADVLADQAARDQRDRTRTHSPLGPAPGAVELDTTSLTVEQVVARIAGLVRA